MYFEVVHLCAKDKWRSLMRAEQCCNCGGVTVKMKQCLQSEITTQNKGVVGFVYKSFGNI